jgi:hypothetical protein
MSKKSDVLLAIEYIEECKASHVAWARYRHCGGTKGEVAGDEKWHRKWMRQYNHVLKVLRARI